MRLQRRDRHIAMSNQGGKRVCKRSQHHKKSTYAHLDQSCVTWFLHGSQILPWQYTQGEYAILKKLNLRGVRPPPQHCIKKEAFSHRPRKSPNPHPHPYTGARSLVSTLSYTLPSSTYQPFSGRRKKAKSECLWWGTTTHTYLERLERIIRGIQLALF